MVCIKYSFKEQLMVACQQTLKVKDIEILVNCCPKIACDHHQKIKMQLGDSYIYPIPTEAVLDYFKIDVKKLERAALLEFKLQKKKDT